MSTALSQLTGCIALQLGEATPQLRNERPDVVHALTRGKPAAALPGLLSALFAMCAHAHRLTAQRAVRAARGDLAPLTPDEARALQMETLREHLRRMWLDWPRLWAPVPASLLSADLKPSQQNASAMQRTQGAMDPLSALASCPAVQGQQAQAGADEALQAWLTAHVYGQSPAGWLAAWQAEPDAFMQHWCQTTDTLPARQIRAVWPLAASLRFDMAPLLMEPAAADASSTASTWMKLLAINLGQQPGFARMPNWGGAQVETGPWCRANQARVQPDRCEVHPLQQAQHEHGNAPARASLSMLARLGGRLADLARLALPDLPAGAPGPASQGGITGPCGRHVLQAGAISLGEHSALAWTEMARGTLLHWVRLSDAGPGATVQACQVLAPTEWNCHPQGPVATLLADPELSDACRAQMAGLLTAVYDPCVPLVLRGPDGATLAQYPPMVQTVGQTPAPRHQAGCGTASKESSCTN